MNKFKTAEFKLAHAISGLEYFASLEFAPKGVGADAQRTCSKSTVVVNVYKSFFQNFAFASFQLFSK